MTRSRLSRIFWIGAAAILVAAALVALVAVVEGDFSDTDSRILVTLGALLYTGAAALSGLALVDAGRARALGWLLAGSAPLSLAFILWAVWSLGGSGDDRVDKLAWSSALALVAGLIATTGLLLARRPALVRLAAGAGVLAGLAATLSVAAIWTEPGSDTYGKLVAALWIVAALGYFLVPILQRFTAAGVAADEVRVLATLGDVELVASRGRVEGVAVESPQAGERLTLRHR